MSYSQIDPIIDAWSKKHILTVYTSYQDSEVRSVDVVNSVGRKFQIWIDKPQGSKVFLHAWDYKKRHQDWEVELGKLGSVLEEAIQLVRSWSDSK